MSFKSAISQVRVKSEDYMQALMSIDSNPERAELRAAGTPERTINVLYPPRFEDLVPGLTRLLSYDNAFAHVAKNAPWNDAWSRLNGKKDGIDLRLGATVRQELSEQYENFKNGNSWEPLHARILEIIPDQMGKNIFSNEVFVSSKESQVERVHQLIETLWQMHWHMLHLPQNEGMEFRVRDYFTNVIDGIFPAFLIRVGQQSFSEDVGDPS